MKEPARIDYSKQFEKQLKKAPLKIKKAFKERLQFFMADESDPLLNNHSLTGEYKGYRSINITGNWRAVFRKLEGGEVTFFDSLGTHPQLYKKF